MCQTPEQLHAIDMKMQEISEQIYHGEMEAEGKTFRTNVDF